MLQDTKWEVSRYLFRVFAFPLKRLSSLATPRFWRSWLYCTIPLLQQPRGMKLLSQKPDMSVSIGALFGTMSYGYSHCTVGTEGGVKSQPLYRRLWQGHMVRKARCRWIYYSTLYRWLRVCTARLGEDWNIVLPFRRTLARDHSGKAFHALSFFLRRLRPRTRQLLLVSQLIPPDIYSSSSSQQNLLHLPCESVSRGNLYPLLRIPRMQSGEDTVSSDTINAALPGRWSKT